MVDKLTIKKAVAETRAVRPTVRRQALPSRSGKKETKTENLSLNSARAIKTRSIKSVGEFITELDTLQYVKNKLWFRGVGNSAYALLPSLFRNKVARTQTAYQELELDLNETFQNRSIPYTGNSLTDGSEWDRLFFMQHYRVPTRLLDWSGSPLVSLHFAVTSVKSDESGNPANDVAVWVMDPIRWNNAAYADTGFPGGVLSARDSWLKRYSPSEVYTQAAGLPPIALRGVHNSPRIVAQQGFFTVFGPRADSMEKIFNMERDGILVFPDNCLVKFVIPKDSVSKVREEIFSLGISESTIYPDLEGLADELKRIFKF